MPGPREPWPQAHEALTVLFEPCTRNPARTDLKAGGRTRPRFCVEHLSIGTLVRNHVPVRDSLDRRARPFLPWPACEADLGGLRTCCGSEQRVADVQRGRRKPERALSSFVRPFNCARFATMNILQRGLTASIPGGPGP